MVLWLGFSTFNTAAWGVIPVLGAEILRSHIKLLHILDKKENKKGFFFFLAVPRLGVVWELQLPAYSAAIAMLDPSLICNLYQSSRQGQILNTLSEARD